jgi:hypothetical protein
VCSAGRPHGGAAACVHPEWHIAMHRACCRLQRVAVSGEVGLTLSELLWALVLVGLVCYVWLVQRCVVLGEAIMAEL